jgi:hypothetical protein
LALQKNRASARFASTGEYVGDFVERIKQKEGGGQQGQWGAGEWGSKALAPAERGGQVGSPFRPAPAIKGVPLRQMEKPAARFTGSSLKPFALTLYFRPHTVEPS